MDLSPLLNSGNIWLIAIGIGITLLMQWAKQKFAPANPNNPTPTPGPTPAPTPGGSPILDALLDLLKKRLLANAAPVSFGEGPVAPSAPRVSADHQAAEKLLQLLRASE